MQCNFSIFLCQNKIKYKNNFISLPSFLDPCNWKQRFFLGLSSMKLKLALSGAPLTLLVEVTRPLNWPFLFQLLGVLERWFFSRHTFSRQVHRDGDWSPWTRTRVGLESDSSPDLAGLGLESFTSGLRLETCGLDSDRRDSTRTVGTRPDSANCTDKNRFQAT